MAARTGWRSVAAVFSNEKDFGHPVIGHGGLNRWGLHVLRIVLADACYLLRTLPFCWLHPVLWWRFLHEGYVVLPRFLPDADFQAVRDEYEAATARYHAANPLQRTGERGFGAKRPRQGGFDRYDGDSANRFVDIARGGAIQRRFCASWRYTTLALALFGMFNWQRKHSIYELVHGDEALNPDVQRELHKDTFHPTFKTWYYLDEVGPQHGPTEVVPRSHRSPWIRLRWEYRRSLPQARVEHGTGGSFRIPAQDLAALGLAQPRPIPCAANSLVVVNTKAFHRRGTAPRDTMRRSLYANFRPAAFSPIIH